MISDPFVWLVLLPLAWAILAFWLGPGRGAWVALSGLAAQVVLTFRSVADLVTSGPSAHAIGGWGQPLGIDLAVDGLSAVMLLLTQALAFPLAAYARFYFSPDAPEAAYFWPLFGFLVAGLNALFISTDLFNIYVTLEVIGLASVGLVAAGGQADQIAAALRYLFASLIGSGAYLLAVALIYGTYGTVSMVALAPLMTADAPMVVGIAGGLILVGLMLKTALFPFHGWLPPAHGSAPAPVSALLSAVVVKASFYLILRLWLGPFAQLAGAVSLVPAVLGAAAILWGSYQAVRSQRIKMLVAYSTVAQLGYLFLIFPLLSGADAVQAGMMHACAHGLAKAAMFAAAGVLIKATGRDAVDGLAGVADRLPVTLFAFGLAGVTLMGLPPTLGFLAKWQLIVAALARGHWIIVVATLAGGLFAAVYVFRVLRQAFLIAPDSRRLQPVPRILEWIAFSLAAASVLLGVRSVELMNVLAIGSFP